MGASPSVSPDDTEHLHFRAMRRLKAVLPGMLGSLQEWQP
jgi:hypothetical protein